MLNALFEFLLKCGETINKNFILKSVCNLIASIIQLFMKEIDNKALLINLI